MFFNHSFISIKAKFIPKNKRISSRVNLRHLTLWLFTLIVYYTLISRKNAWRKIKKSKIKPFSSLKKGERRLTFSFPPLYLSNEPLNLIEVVSHQNKPHTKSHKPYKIDIRCSYLTFNG